MEGGCCRYCDSFDRRPSQGEGQQYGSSGAVGHFHGDVLSRLLCGAAAAVSPLVPRGFAGVPGVPFLSPFGDEAGAGSKGGGADEDGDA